jgi:hypothetical protein
VVDYKNALVKVFLKNGRLDYVIGTPKKSTSEKVLGLKLSSPGIVSVSEDDDIYIQDRITLGKAIKLEERDPFNMTSGFFAMREPEYLPSYILHIASNKKDTNVIGINGINSEPFRYIENIIAGDKGKLFVIHRISTSIELNYYQKGILKGQITENDLEIFSAPENSKYSIKLESIIPDKMGNYALLLFNFTGKQDERFKFRRVYKYKYGEQRYQIMLKEFQNPSEILFGLLPNGEFITWETEGSEDSVKLLLHDQRGNHISNKRISFKPPRVKWRETYQDFRDNIYSIRIDAGQLELYEWN